MRIGFVTWTNDAPTGGNVYNRELVAALVGAGVQVRRRAIAGSWPAASRADLARLAAALRTERVSIVDGIVASGAPTAIRAAVAAGHVVVVLLHLPIADEVGLPPTVRARYGALESAALSAASGIVCPSQWAAANAAERFDLARLAVAAPGVGPAPLAPGSAGAPRLLVLAALTPTKDQITVIRALAQLRQLDWTAHLVGSLSTDPGYADRVRTEVGVARLTDRVWLTGPLVGAALEREWQATDLLVLSSKMETYGLVVSEALARGIPAVVSAGTGAVEALAAGTDGMEALTAGSLRPAEALPGRAVPPGEPNALAATLREWLTEPELRASWRAAAEASRGRLPSWTRTARQVLDFLATC
jgi:glycosyltransferase involved in cell wall biosynthesis